MGSKIQPNQEMLFIENMSHTKLKTSSNQTSSVKYMLVFFGLKTRKPNTYKMRLFLVFLNEPILNWALVISS